MSPATFIPPVPVPIAAALLLLLAGVLAFLAIRSTRQPLWALPSAMAVVLAIGLFLAQPNTPLPPKTNVPEDLGEAANFKTRYDNRRAMYGEPIECETAKNSNWSCWFTYGRMESHPKETDPNWKVMLGNLGLELMQAKGIAEDKHPVVPSVIAAFMTAEANRGIDTLYSYGYPRTHPRQVGDEWEQYWDKAVLRWPATSADSAEDPAAVKRLPVGTIVWSLSRSGQNPVDPEPWTDARRWILGGALTCLALTGLPVFIPGPFKRREWSYDF